VGGHVTYMKKHVYIVCLHSWENQLGRLWYGSGDNIEHYLEKSRFHKKMVKRTASE
jgi:hypothetical protein